MYEFNVHKPAAAADAVSALKGADDGKFLAGGQTLIPTLKQRLGAHGQHQGLGGAGARPPADGIAHHIGRVFVIRPAGAHQIEAPAAKEADTAAIRP